MSKNHRKPSDRIVIDEAKGLVFDSESELYDHFSNEIQFLEQEFFELRAESGSDIPEEDFEKYNANLSGTLDDPDEIWMDTETFSDTTLYIYLRYFDEVFHVAVCYLTDRVPSFVYLHFPTTNEDLLEKYRRGRRTFVRSGGEVHIGAIEGDSLFEGDELAVGLYSAMLLLRSKNDIPEVEFLNYVEFREATLEEADEIWRSADSMGNILVSFIKDFGEVEDELYYLVVTVEDAPSGSHALLFSFPTNDKSLVERYRHGENLQADEVVQESSH